MKNAIHATFLNFFNKGAQLDITDQNRIDSAIRNFLLKLLLIFLIVFLLISGFLNFYSTPTYVVKLAFSEPGYFQGLLKMRGDSLINAIVDLFAATLFGSALILLCTRIRFSLSATYACAMALLFFSYQVYSGGFQGAGILWSFIFPLFVIFFLGLSKGFILSFLLYIFIGCCFYIPGFAAMTYPQYFKARAFAIYPLSMFIAVIYELTKIVKENWISSLFSELKNERDVAVTMRDNLKSGFFFMDEKWIIQPHYSKALAVIFEQEQLEGKDFTSLLVNSLKEEDLEVFRDYLAMVIKRSFDSKMLDDINPIYQFTYVGANGSEKILKTSFTIIENKKTAMLMGIVEDHTYEAGLEQQVSEDDARRYHEMQSLFEVIHMDPRVLNDFIEETDAEFEHINTVLKNKNLPIQSIITEMYQGVHAIKSNALIIGLSSVAEKLHALEDVIRNCQNHPDSTYQDVLHIMIELDNIMKTNDDLRGIIDKIKSFSHNEQRMQTSQVLVQTLERIVERQGRDLHKKAQILCKRIDLREVNSTTRHVIKDILVQLVRNSMYHGIEIPDIRKAYGKNECGSIIIGIEILKAQEKIKIEIIDDGAGVDFQSVKLRAKDYHLVDDPEKLEDRNTLAKLIFKQGFSTQAESGLHAGRGVGLSLVHDRIKAAGGTIQLQTEDNKGTAFTILLPLIVKN